ncbi:MAG TPA: M23 family metallopeptidase [Terracidiphilus sp.]|nr:M23 family metallopeptidase [Terracidiphilus sp.]
MLRKRYYILFVSRDEDGRVRKIPVPLRYAYGFVAAAIVGAFTIMGLAGSYTRMLLKTESYNQVRQDREKLRKDYKQMAQIAHERDVQVASLGALASEVSALYGLRQNRMAAARHSAAASAASTAPAPASAALAVSNDVNPQAVKGSIDQLAALRDYALSGRVSMALEDGLTPGFTGDWTTLADSPSLWPVEGEVTSSFGEREDPIRDEGEFHTGIDIAAGYGTAIHAAAAGLVTGADMGHGYGRTVELNNGHDIMTVYAHLSAVAVVAGQHVSRGQVIGYLGDSGRTTGPNLHYEVRVDGVPVNPYKYLRNTYRQFARVDVAQVRPPAGQ